MKIELQSFIEEIHSLFRTDFDNRKIKFLSEIEPDDQMLRADRNLLQQVMINLVRNGMDALENVDNPKLEISSQTKKGSIRISVTDNGAGIDQDILDEIFVPFYTTKSQGSGIGLSLARQVMRMHGGNIWITSRKGEGTTVYLDFQG